MTIVKIEKELSLLKTYPNTEIQIITPPINIDERIITNLGTYQNFNIQYKGACSTKRIKKIIPKITVIVIYKYKAAVTSTKAMQHIICKMGLIIIFIKNYVR